MRGAGSLDRRITIERYARTQDAFGGDVLAWSVLTEVYASRADISDAERLSAGQLNATQSARFIVRSSVITRSVDAKDRLVVGDDVWDVHGIKETKEGRMRFLEITATRQAD